MDRIQIYSNEGNHPSPRESNTALQPQKHKQIWNFYQDHFVNFHQKLLKSIC